MAPFLSFTLDLANYIQADGIGTVATDIFVGNIPDTIPNGLMLLTRAGAPQNLYMDIRTVDIDFWTRNLDATKGYDTLGQLWNLLHIHGNFSTDNFFIMAAYATGDIEDMARDVEGRKLYKLPMRFIIRLLEAIS